MSDLISRRAAIDAVRKDYDTILDFKSDGATVASSIEDILLALPSAQPEQAIKDCRNCKHGSYNDHWDTYFCYCPNDCSDWNKWGPSAQSFNKGLWVKQELAPQTLLFCSLCGCKKPQGVVGNFCPNCGADMRGEEG